MGFDEWRNKVGYRNSNKFWYTFADGEDKGIRYDGIVTAKGFAKFAGRVQSHHRVEVGRP